MAPVKRKLTNKSLAEKFKALKDLENGFSNKGFATKYSVPRNTVSTWVKNKHKLTASLEKKGMNSSRKNTRCGNYEKIDKAIYNWFVEEALDKPQDLSLFNSYENKIGSLESIIETFLNKE